MPRVKREKSETKIYHVISRGINRQNIFEDSQDCAVFLQILSKMAKDRCCTVYAWCLMNNHYHLLIKEEKKTINMIMLILGDRYALYFNNKYNRIGYVFQDRFKSTPIADNKQFLATCRYIHMNPVKAKICAKPETYPYSSYREYLTHAKVSGVKAAAAKMIDPSFVLSMIEIKEFMKFTMDYDDEKLLDYSPDRYNRMSDHDAKEIMNSVCGCKNTSEFQLLDPVNRNDAISKMIKAGVMIRQASRLTGYSTTLIYKAIRK